jgi:nucleoside-diphosphate-sugar epimerase
LVAEDGPRRDDPSEPKFNHLMWITEEAVMRAHREGHYSATYFRYPLLYGAHAPANPDWSIVRRLLDGRKRLIVPANGVCKRRGAARNVAHALLLAVDQAAESAGQIYNIRDEHQYTHRQYVRFIARHLNRDCEIVEVPPLLAQRVYKGGAASVAEWTIEFDITKIRTQLGYRDCVAPAQALGEAVDWLAANRPAPGGEVERQLGDPFAYGAEDAMLKAFEAGVDAAAAVEFPHMALGHMYRHPKKPGEQWKPPSRGDNVGT